MKQENKNLKVINVLEEKYFKKEHLPESINIPEGSETFLEAVEKELGSKTDPVVVYCASLECDASPKAARKLEDAGYTQVYDFEGGVKEWKENNLPIVLGGH